VKFYALQELILIIQAKQRIIHGVLLSTKANLFQNSLFIVAQEHNDKMSLESFSQNIFNYFGLKNLTTTFENWEKAFLFLANNANNEKIVIILDEFPYIAHSNKSVPSILQNAIDHHLKNTKMFFIICGSSICFMEKEVLSYKSPLYGRGTAQMLIEPFNYLETCSNFFEQYTLIEQGLTDYLFDEKIEPEINHYMGLVFENVCMQFLKIKNVKKELPFVFEKVGRWWGTNPSFVFT
jgi:AAA+ ATPase superfamily predicted ATPase